MKTSGPDVCGSCTHNIEVSELKDSVLSSTLEFKGRPVQVYLTSNCQYLCWHSHAANGTSLLGARGLIHCIPVCDIFGVTYEALLDNSQKSKNIELLPGTVFRVHFIKAVKNHRWKDKGINFLCSDTEECQLWVKTINNILEDFARPKKLLIFVNPVGGKKLARRVFSEKVAPLFDIAKIKQDVVVTERAKHAEDYILDKDLEGYDGIISVGGDGMFSEVLNGYLKREARVNGIDAATGVPAKGKSICLGIIPAGSTDTVVYCTTGTNDPVTSALHIIVGDTLSLDVCSVWSRQQIARYYVSLMGYGFFGDTMKSSEKFRWMGPRRYDLAGFLRFMAYRSYRGEVSYLPAPSEQSDPKQLQACRTGCTRCSSEFDEPDYHKTSWKTVRGRFTSVLGANITCRCAKSVNGISPGAHLGDGFTDLILIRSASRGQYLRHLLQVANSGDPFDFNFVDVYRVKEFKFRPIDSDSDDGEELVDCHNLKEGQRDSSNSSHYSASDDDSTSSNSSSRSRQTSLWNIDGELLEDPEVHVKAHRQLVTIFARGIEDDEETISCRPCQRKI